MRIAIVAPVFEHVAPPNAAGGAPGFATLINGLAAQLSPRHSVEVYSPADGAFAPSSTHAHEGVTYRYIDVKRDQMIAKLLTLAERALDFPLRGHPFYSAPAYYAGYAQAAAQAAQGFKADAIFFWQFPSLAPVLRHYNPNARLILDMQNDWLAQLDHGRMAGYLRHVDVVAACSAYIRDRTAAAFPEMHARPTVLLNGMTLESASVPAPTSGARIVYAGRLSPDKGAQLVIAAFARVQAQIPDVTLDIAGALTFPPYEHVVPISTDPLTRGLGTYYGGRMRKPNLGFLDAARAALPPDGAARVKIHPDASKSDMKALLMGATVFCLPPVWDEPSPNPVVEAMALGVPVVTSASGGIREVAVDGETALVVPRGDAEALANALVRLLGDAALRKRLALAAQARLSDMFSYARMTADFEALMS